MVGVEILEHIMHTIFCSTQVEGSNPLSALLIAPPDAGKSQLLLRLRHPEARILNDFTYATILDIVSRDAPKWIVVPDFNTVVSHRPSVATLTAAVLLGLMAEGTAEIPGLDGRAKIKVEALKSRGKCVSIITGVTPGMFKSKRGTWRHTGFLRRLMPINYEYSQATVRKIQDSIRDGTDSLDYGGKQLTLPKKVFVEIREPEKTQIDRISSDTIKQLGWTSFTAASTGAGYHVQAVEYPFSIHKMFRVYARSHAIIMGRKRVEQEDIESLEQLASFVRYDKAKDI